MRTTLAAGTLLPDADGETRRWPSWRLSRGLQVEIEQIGDIFIATTHGLRGEGERPTLAIDSLLAHCAELAEPEDVSSIPPRWIREHLEPNSPVWLRPGMEWEWRGGGSRNIWRINRLVRVPISCVSGVWHASPPSPDAPPEAGSGWHATSAVDCLLTWWAFVASSRYADVWPMSVENYEWVCRTLSMEE